MATTTTTSTSTSTKAAADSTTADAAKKMQAASTAFNHFSQGKRHLLVGDFKSAVSAFKEATDALVELYGEQAPECGDAYYHYGHALLELARREAGVLGQDLDAASTSQEGSTGEEEDEDEEEEAEEESEESQEEEDGEKEGEEGEKKEGEEDEQEKEEEEKDGKGKEKSKKKNVEEGEGENTEEEEEVTTLQCAWEWLDVARVIFDKQEESPEVAKKRAQIRLSLGEVCMESEDYEGAVNEFQQCLDIQVSVLSSDDRSLAETHYQLGLVHSLSDNFDLAITHYTAAVKVIQLKIKNLQAQVQEKNSWDKERREKYLAERKDVFYTEEGEIQDLEQLLPDIEHKITDMQEMKAAADQRTQLQQQAAKALLLGSRPGTSAASGAASAAVFSQAKEEGEGSSTSTTTTTTTAAAAEPKKISLCEVRRKRKPEESEVAEEQKKQRLDNGVKADGTKDEAEPASSAPAKLIAVKRKVTQNGRDASVASSTKADPSSTSTDSATQDTK